MLGKAGSNGRLNSKVRKSAAEAEIANTNNAAMLIGSEPRERAEAREDNGEPEDQHRQKRHRDQVVSVFKQEQTHVPQ
jgi:hypothetical protein